MQLGRVLVVDEGESDLGDENSAFASLRTKGWTWRYRNQHCEMQRAKSLRCYFLPFSNCSVAQAFRAQHAAAATATGTSREGEGSITGSQLPLWASENITEGVDGISRTSGPWDAWEKSRLRTAVKRFGAQGRWGLVAAELLSGSNTGTTAGLRSTYGSHVGVPRQGGNLVTAATEVVVSSPSSSSAVTALSSTGAGEENFVDPLDGTRQAQAQAQAETPALTVQHRKRRSAVECFLQWHALNGEVRGRGQGHGRSRGQGRGQGRGVGTSAGQARADLAGKFRVAQGAEPAAHAPTQLLSLGGDRGGEGEVKVLDVPTRGTEVVSMLQITRITVASTVADHPYGNCSVKALIDTALSASATVHPAYLPNTTIHAHSTFVMACHRVVPEVLVTAIEGICSRHQQQQVDNNCWHSEIERRCGHVRALLQAGHGFLWWRAVAAAYLVRPNTPTLLALDQHAAPVVLFQAPRTTSSAPATTPSAPATTSSAPATTSSAPATTSSAPATTSSAPATTATLSEHGSSLNSRTAMMVGKFSDFTSACASVSASDTTVVVDNSVGVYVRHGDKGVEMELQPFERYGAAALHLWNNYFPSPSSTLKSSHCDCSCANEPCCGPSLTSRCSQSSSRSNSNRSSSRICYDSCSCGRGRDGAERRLYLSTDDPAVLGQARRWGRRHNVTVLVSSLAQPLLSDKRAVVRQQQLEQEGRTAQGRGRGQSQQGRGRSQGQSQQSQGRTRQLEYLSYLLHLSQLVQCAGVLCTLPSNYCRLVDELRATVGFKAAPVPLIPTCCAHAAHDRVGGDCAGGCVTEEQECGSFTASIGYLSNSSGDLKVMHSGLSSSGGGLRHPQHQQPYYYADLSPETCRPSSSSNPSVGASAEVGAAAAAAHRAPLVCVRNATTAEYAGDWYDPLDRLW